MGTPKTNKVLAVSKGRNALERDIFARYGAPIPGLSEVVMPKNQKAYCVAVILGAAEKSEKDFVANVNLLDVLSTEKGFVKQVVAEKDGKPVVATAKPYCEGKHVHALKAGRAPYDMERKYVSPTIAAMRGAFGDELRKAMATITGTLVGREVLNKHLDKWEKANA